MGYALIVPVLCHVPENDPFLGSCASALVPNHRMQDSTATIEHTRFVFVISTPPVGGSWSVVWSSAVPSADPCSDQSPTRRASENVRRGAVEATSLPRRRLLA